VKLVQQLPNMGQSVLFAHGKGESVPHNCNSHISMGIGSSLQIFGPPPGHPCSGKQQLIFRGIGMQSVLLTHGRRDGLPCNNVQLSIEIVSLHIGPNPSSK
jgi:hypothetical protein